MQVEKPKLVWYVHFSISTHVYILCMVKKTREGFPKEGAQIHRGSSWPQNWECHLGMCFTHYKAQCKPIHEPKHILIVFIAFVWQALLLVL
jgi:hypothetical protein